MDGRSDQELYLRIGWDSALVLTDKVVTNRISAGKQERVNHTFNEGAWEGKKSSDNSYLPTMADVPAKNSSRISMVMVVWGVICMMIGTWQLAHTHISPVSLFSRISGVPWASGRGKEKDPFPSDTWSNEIGKFFVLLLPLCLVHLCCMTSHFIMAVFSHKNKRCMEWSKWKSAMEAVVLNLIRVVKLLDVIGQPLNM